MKIKDELGNIILVPKNYEKKVRKLILGDDTAELEILLKKFGGSVPKYQQGSVNTTGYTPGTDTYDNPYNIIPGGDITMRNTPFPVMGYPLTGNSNVGMPVLMYPGKDYKFPGASGVLEVPMKQTGDVAAPAQKPRYDTDGDLIYEVSEDGLQFAPALSIPQAFKEKAREAYVAEGNKPEDFDAFWVEGLKSELVKPDFSLDGFKQIIEKNTPKEDVKASEKGVADMQARLLGQKPKEGQKPTLLGGEVPQIPTITLGQPAANEGGAAPVDLSNMPGVPPYQGLFPGITVPELPVNPYDVQGPAPADMGINPYTVYGLDEAADLTNGLYQSDTGRMARPGEYTPDAQQSYEEYQRLLRGPEEDCPPYHELDAAGNCVPIPMDKLGKKRRVVEEVTGFDPGAKLDEILRQAEEKIKQLEGMNQQEYQKALQDYGDLLGDLRGYARGQAGSAMLGNIAQNPYTQAVLKQQGLADATRKARRIPQYFLDVQRAEGESQMNAMANQMLANGARPSEVASIMAPYYERQVNQQNDLAMKVYASNAAADADYYSFLTSLQNENIAADVQNRNAILAALNKKIATSADIGTDLLRNLAALRTMETNLPRSAAQTMYGNEMNLLRTRLGLDRDRIGVDVYKDQRLLDEQRRAEARAMDEQRRRDAEAARAEQERRRKEEADKKAAENAAKTKAEQEDDEENASIFGPETDINPDEEFDLGVEDGTKVLTEEVPEPFDPGILVEEPAAAEAALPIEFKSDSPIDRWGMDLGALDPEMEKEALSAFPWLPSLNQVTALAQKVQGAVEARGGYISPRTARIIEEGIKSGRFVRDPKTKIVLEVPVKVSNTILWDPKNPNASSITKVVENLERLGLITVPK